MYVILATIITKEVMMNKEAMIVAGAEKISDEVKKLK